VGALITEKKGGKELARNIFTAFIPLFENAAEHTRVVFAVLWSRGISDFH